MLPAYKRARAVIACSAALLSSLLAGCGGGGGGGGGGGALVASVPASASSTPPAAVYKQPSGAYYDFRGSFRSEGLASRMQIEGSRDINDDYIATSMDVTLDEERRSFLTTALPNHQSTGQQDRHDVSTLSAGMGVTSEMKGAIGSNEADLYTGFGSSDEGDYVSVSSLLRSSLGPTTLSYAYAGLGAKVTATQSGGYDVYHFNFFGGQKTQTSDMPSAGTANYAGAFNGDVTWLDSGRISYADLDGNVSLTADFDANSVRGSIDGIRFYHASEPTRTYIDSPFSIDVNGAISGNQFSGNAQFKNVTTGALSNPRSGVMQGGFFGPQASEAAGALAVTTTGSSGTTLVTGSFGAKKQVK